MKPVSILVAEDNAASMELIHDLFCLAGCRVLQAFTAEDAIAIATRETPHVILMDVGLPGMDGLEATRRLKSDCRTRGIPVVIATSHAMSGEEAKARAAGCDGYITKPFDIGSIVDYVLARTRTAEEGPRD